MKEEKPLHKKNWIRPEMVVLPFNKTQGGAITSTYEGPTYSLPS